MKRGFDLKRAQVTTFIIIGIVIVAAVGGVVYLGKQKIDSDLAREYFSQSGVKPQLDNIQESILNCMDLITGESLEIIGIQGGYYNEPPQAFDLGWAFIPYYYNQGTFAMPDRSVIRSELGEYVDENLESCLNEISLGDFTLDYKTAGTEVTIQQARVLFEIDLPITIEREDNKIKFDTEDYPVSQESKLFQILEIADFVTDSHKEDPDMICINCVAEMAKEREVYVDMLDFDETSTLIVISENVTSEEPYIFEFLNKYSVE